MLWSLLLCCCVALSAALSLLTVCSSLCHSSDGTFTLVTRLRKSLLLKHFTEFCSCRSLSVASLVLTLLDIILAPASPPII
uniref:Putative secreted peptide n=1 Tax=Anopheles braziliensis TaxID=58242 RepID=A0A2M3ZUP7_9DIPT